MVPVGSVAWTVTVLAPAVRPVVGTWAVQTWPVLVAATEAPLPSLTSTAETWSAAPAEAAYTVTGVVAPSVMVVPTPGVLMKADGPAAAVGARATPRNSVFAAAVASTAGLPGVNDAAEPLESVRESSWVGVVTARLTTFPVALATMPRAPGASTKPAEVQVEPLRRYLSIVPARDEPSAM